MKTISRTLSFLPLTILAVGAAIAPVQAQSIQNGRTTDPAATSSDRIGIDASDPYSGQVYSGSQNPDRYDGQPNNQMVDQTNSSPNLMQSRQARCVNPTSSMQAAPDSTVSSTDRIGIDASDPYSEQVYSGSQNTDMNSANMPGNPLCVTSNASSNLPVQQSLSRLQRMRYEVLDRPGS